MIYAYRAAVHIDVSPDYKTTLQELYDSYVNTSLAMGIPTKNLALKTTLANVVSRLHPE